jgi:hypothetical protein
MVAFRKLFPVLAIGAFLLGTASTASAQAIGGNPLVCSTNAGVPPVVRAEGYTELVGDIVIQCVGGNPALGAQLANFQIFLNTNITSRLLADGLSEALLMIDEPGGAANAEFCVSPSVASNVSTTPTCNVAVAGSANQTGTYNVFRGQPARAANGVDNASVVWAGIPIIAPGTNNTRTFRITNIRANATSVPASASLVPSQIFAFISISASQSLALNNPQQAVAFVLPGLQFDVRNCDNSGGGNQTFLQCVSRNSDLANNPGSAGPFSDGVFGVRFREGFQTAFKTRIDTNQTTSVPGVVYNTESGFVRTATTLGSVGLANSATRVTARFNNLPEGIRLFVSTSNVAVTGSNASAILVSTDANGAGGTVGISDGGSVPIGVSASTTLRCTASSTTSPAAELTQSGTGTGRSAVAVWEVTAANASTVDTLFFYVAVAYTANTSGNLPGLGTSTVSGSFAPFYAAGTSQSTGPGSASSSLPIPRFIDTTTTTNQFTINQCVTNLLFPFVTNQAGFDTGIAISNTSRDPFSNASGRVQNGTCTINYYGSTPGGPAPAADTTTNPVNAGEQLLFVLSSGGGNGIDAVPGFQGYIIAQCRFQFAHGFAFVTDGPIGQARVAEGYLALVMDASVGTRTGSTSETLAH